MANNNKLITNMNKINMNKITMNKLNMNWWLTGQRAQTDGSFMISYELKKEE